MKECSMDWRDLAWEEFKLLQGIINRQMEIRWKIRTWLLTVQGTLVLALFTNKLDSKWYVRIALIATSISWCIEMSENFVITECVKRQSSIENTLKPHFTAWNPPYYVPSPEICAVLEKTQKGIPTFLYIIRSLIRLRRLIVYALFVAIPVLIWLVRVIRHE
jgi:hypothetical protein